MEENFPELRGKVRCCLAVCWCWEVSQNGVHRSVVLVVFFLIPQVTGANYPPPPTVELMLKAISFFQLMGIVLAMLGANFFRLIGLQQTPSWYFTVEKNAVAIAIFCYLIVPQMLSKYLVTGAFEIMLDTNGNGFQGESGNINTIFSKLATGRLPQVADLIEPLVQAGLKQAAPSS